MFLLASDLLLFRNLCVRSSLHASPPYSYFIIKASGSSFDIEINLIFIHFIFSPSSSVSILFWLLASLEIEKSEMSISFTTYDWGFDLNELTTLYHCSGEYITRFLPLFVITACTESFSFCVWPFSMKPCSILSISSVLMACHYYIPVLTRTVVRYQINDPPTIFNKLGIELHFVDMILNSLIPCTPYKANNFKLY